MSKTPHMYPRKEEQLNIISHGLGLLLGLISLPFLFVKALSYDGFWKSASFIIFGLSMVILYAASTFYHAAKEPKRRKILNIVDHSAIYVLIAGTYTPFTLVTLAGDTGNLIFLITWGFALVGIILKLFFTGRFDKLSTLMYVLMGWQIVFAIKPLMEQLSTEGLFWLFAGGVFYTLGAVLYSIKKIPYNHAIFHVFVLLGSSSHFIAVFWYCN